MSNTPIKMNKLRQIIRLYCQETSTKTIHGMLGTSRTTIKKYVRIWHELGLTTRSSIPGAIVNYPFFLIRRLPDFFLLQEDVNQKALKVAPFTNNMGSNWRL